MIQPEQNCIDLGTALQMAQRLVSWCDRVRAMHAIVPGAAAQTSIEVDDVEFKIVITCNGPVNRQQQRHDTIADSDGDDGA